jgi:hypothetical protein
VFEVEVSCRGLELSVVSERFPVEIASKLIERLAQETEAAMFFEAPWRSGKLAQSINRQVEGISAKVSPLVPYAMYVEMGTSPHEIRPIHSSVLAFKSTDGKLIFSSLVNHPGTKANPFMHRTAEQIKRKVPAIFASIWQNYLGEEQQ